MYKVGDKVRIKDDSCTPYSIGDQGTVIEQDSFFITVEMDFGLEEGVTWAQLFEEDEIERVS